MYAECEDYCTTNSFRMIRHIGVMTLTEDIFFTARADLALS